MTDDNKKSATFNAFKIGFLIIIIMIFVIPIIYFTLTVPSSSVLESVNKTSLHRENIDRFYRWDIFLQLLAVVALLSLLYLTVTIKLSRVCSKLIAGCTVFIKQISLSEAIISVIIIPPTVFALSLVIRELYCDCSDWWIILSARLSDSEEPLNFRNIIIGIAGAVTLVFAWQRIIIVDEQKEDQVQQTKSHIQQTRNQIRQTRNQIRQTRNQIRQTNIEAGRRLSGRFDNAVGALSKELSESSFPAHLGAISGLQTLAIDSPKHTQTCLDIICSCNQWMEGYIDIFVKKKSDDPYSSWLLNEDNRIAKKGNKNKASKITLLQEKRSQEALKSISYILKEISSNGPNQPQILKFHNKMLCGISLRDIKIDRFDFKKTCLVAADLYNISLNEFIFNSQGRFVIDDDLRLTNLKGANLQGASLNNAQLQKASLGNTNLQGVNLRGANLENAYLDDVNLQGADLGFANLHRARLRGANLQRADLENAELQGAFLDDANLKNASLRRAKLYRAPSLLKNINLQGALSSLKKANLQGADLNEALLQEASLEEANLQGASLESARLQGAYLISANLQGVKLKDTKMQGAILKDTKLQGAILRGVELKEARLVNTQLQGAIMDNVDLSNTMLIDCNLYGTTLKNIKSDNIIFNNISDIGCIRSKKEKKKFLDGICKYMKQNDTKLFTQKMKAAWKAMNSYQEPNELKKIRSNSIVTQNNKGMYDISPKKLSDLEKRWQQQVNKEGTNFLYYMKNFLPSLNRETDKNVNLVNKLQAVIDRLIESNKTQKNKQPYKLEWM